MKWVEHVTRLGKGKLIQDFGTKTRRKGTTWKTQAYMVKY
jgi:hypothetical protein